MAGPLLFDRVRETTTTTGTGDLTLAGAVTGFQTFAAVMSIGDTAYVAISMDGNAIYEVGIYTYSALNTLTRTTILESSNSDLVVSLPAGSKDVFITAPASFLKPMTTTGDIVYQASDGKPTRLPIGSAGEVLKVSGGGIPDWDTDSAYTDEQAQDAIGTILVDTATIDLTYSDATPSISADVINDSITFAKIQNISSDRLLGRDTAGSGDTEEITVGGGVEFTGSTGIQTSAFTGDATKTAGGTALTLATVNGNVGTFGSATQVSQVTVNGKGLVTAAADVAISVTSSAITDFTEAAQDAVGAMVNTSLVYTDGGPTLAQASRTIGGVAYDGTANIVPQTIESANEATDTTCFPLFITASGTQQLQPKNNTGLTYNSSTNTLGATTFSGNLTGNADTATLATNVSSANEATDTTCFPLFITASGTQTTLATKNNTSLTFNSNTAQLGASILQSTVATGTAPLVIASTTLCTNLNADLLDGKNTGTSGNTIPLLDGTNTWSGGQTVDLGDAAAFRVEDSGVFEDVFIVDTTVPTVTNNAAVVITDPSTGSGAALIVSKATALAGANRTVMQFNARNTGTPSSNFGGNFLLNADSSTTDDQAVGRWIYRWTTTTHASRIGQIEFTVYDFNATGNGREFIRAQADGARPNMGFLGASDYASGSGVIAILNATTAPSGTPSGGGVLYVESGALKYKGSSGTVTTIANA